MSIREEAIRGTITPLFENCAANENITVQALMQGVAQGTICIPKNKNHHFDKIIGVGKGLSTKVNANIGSSKDYPEVSQELQKLCVCLKAGADTV
ncbi:MAG: phosphomethylpyrimidine synthase ThiC, partial [Proteobacteria bacterium]|nr:phosphomethylpyrimidine synthase ThiC [Pseudomonadota bacterium]